MNKKIKEVKLKNALKVKKSSSVPVSKVMKRVATKKMST